VKLELRAMTNRCRKRDKAVMISSTTPSANPLEPNCSVIQFDQPLTSHQLQQAASLIADRSDVELYVYGEGEQGSRVLEVLVGISFHTTLGGPKPRCHPKDGGVLGLAVAGANHLEIYAWNGFFGVFRGILLLRLPWHLARAVPPAISLGFDPSASSLPSRITCHSGISLGRVGNRSSRDFTI
jgi:hypothetical protein